MKKALPFSPGRVALVLLAVGGLVAAALLPGELVWVVLGAAGFAALVFFLLAADAMLGWWLKNSVGRAVNLTTFLLERFPSLLLTAAALIAGFLGFAWVKLPESALKQLLLTRSAIAIFVFAGLAVIRALASADNEFLRLRNRLPVVPVRRQIIAALEFERTVAPRLILAFLKTGLAALPVRLIILASAGGLCWLGLLLAGEGAIQWTSWESIPLLAKIGLVGGFGASFLLLAALKLTWLRLVAVARVRGRVPIREIWNHADRAFGAIGVIPAFMTSIWLLLFLLTAGFSGYYFVELFQQQGLDPLPAQAAGAAAAAALLWLLVLFPAQWVLPLMTKRDCGWIRAIEASTRLVGIERTRAFVIGGAAAVLTLTVVGIPAAYALLLGALDDLDPLIGLLLREKTLREANTQAEEAEELSEMPQTIQKGFEHLREGRYLDAVNAFQMYLRTHPGQLAAMRGEAIAMLHLGNHVMARDRLEKWLRLDPENDEARKLYREWEEGLWKEGGERFESARLRSVQEIGTGLRPRDMLGDDG